MKIEILGTGCRNCIKLESLVDEVLVELGRKDFTITRIDDERTIRRYMPVDNIPGLLIDGVLASQGEVPSRETLKEWFSKSH